MAVSTFVSSLYDLEETRLRIAARLPHVDVSSDIAVVVVSARLTIAAITLFLVWFLAARFARWLLAVMALVDLWGIAAALPRFASADGDYVAVLSLRLAFIAGVSCLFLPSGRRWFAATDHHGGGAR